MKGGFPELNKTIKFHYLQNRTDKIYIESGTSNFTKRGMILKFANGFNILFGNQDAWKKPVPFNSTLPYLVRPLSSLSEAQVYLREQYRSVKFVKKTETIEQQFGFDVLQWDPSNFHTDLDVFDTSIPGLNNLSRFESFSIVTTLPNFALSSLCLMK